MEDDFLKEIEKMDEEPSNEIVEIDENIEASNSLYDKEEKEEEVKEKEKKPKKDNVFKKLKDKWQSLSKKQKIIISVSLIVLILLIIGLLVYFIVIKDDKTSAAEPKVVIEKENYRYEDGSLVFLNENKKELGRYECKNKDEDLCYVAYYSVNDEYDGPKMVYENGKSVNLVSDIFKERYVFVYDNKKENMENVTLYDIDQKKEIDSYEKILEAGKNNVIVLGDKGYNLLDLSSSKVDEVFNSSYDYLGYIADTDFLIAGDNNNYFLIDFDGKIKSHEVSGKIMSFDSQNISVLNKDKREVYGYDGVLKINQTFDYVSFTDSYIIAINDGKMYIFDKDGAPMNIDGIKISSDDYDEKIIINEKTKKEVERKKSYGVSILNNKMQLEIGSEKININLEEGAVNKTMPYVSYFSGKLYIFSDSEKTNLLGSYSCSYANSVTGDNAFSNCYIAKESNIMKPGEELINSYLPIFNNRFIFIVDTKKPNSNDNIVLWDLTNKKKLATYKEVDALYHSSDAISFVDTAGTYIFAKNTSDSYGLINVTKDSVQGVIPFKDKVANVLNSSISYLQDNILIKRGDGTYHLYDSKGSELTPNVSTTSEIVEFKNNHIKVKSSDAAYQVYSLDGKVVSGVFKYIIMENNFYISVDDNNKIGVYKYNSKDNLFKSNVVLPGKDFSKEIKYTVSGNTLKITYIQDNFMIDENISVE